MEDEVEATADEAALFSVEMMWSYERLWMSSELKYERKQNLNSVCRQWSKIYFTYKWKKI